MPPTMNTRETMRVVELAERRGLVALEGGCVRSCRLPDSKRSLKARSEPLPAASDSAIVLVPSQTIGHFEPRLHSGTEEMAIRLQTRGVIE